MASGQGAARTDPDFAGGERIVAQIDLRKKCREIPTRGAAEDPVLKAEAALARLSGHFRHWIDEELGAIDAALATLRARGADDEEARTALFRAAHDLKGQAATLGFPLVGVLAGSLCALLDEPADPSAVPMLLIEQHVAGLKAMVREGASGDHDPVASALAQELGRAARSFIASVKPRD